MKPNKNARGFWRSIREFAFALAYDERDESEALQPEINFGGNQRWSTRRYQPDSEAEVLDILTRHSGQTIRVLGSRHSWSDIAADAAVSIDMKRLNGVELIERNGEPVVRVGAGCRLQDLLDWLHERTDRTLPTLGAIKKQTISGAISTGTHGSGRQSLSHYVARIRAAVFDAESGQPVIREFSEGPELEAARCGLGCMGVMLTVELPTVPKYKIAETVRIRQSLEEILALYADQPLTQFFWTPYSWVWLTFERRPVGEPRLSSWDRVKARVFRVVSLVAVDVVFHLFVIASRKAAPAGVRGFFRIVPYIMVKNRERIDDAARVLTMEHDLFRHEEMELFARQDDLARVMEVVRAAIEVCAGTSTQIPPGIEQQLREIGAYDALVAMRGSYVHHYVVFCRRVMPEDTMVSMAASADQPYYSVSLFTYDRPQQRQSYYEFCGWLARTLLQLFDARLHWGKHFPLEYQDVAPLYPRLSEFRALCHTVDPAGVLRNNYTARVLDLPPGRSNGSPQGIDRTPAAQQRLVREYGPMTADTSLSLRGSCECGTCSFEVHTSPKTRFRCHCLICQAFNGKPFADVVAVRGKDVVLKNAGNISFKKYRPPPNFNRGLCRICGKPVVEVAGFGPFKVMFIPASNFEPGARLPPVRMDIFYHRRVLDMPDSLPKYSGYFSSELAIGKMIMSGL